MSPGALWWVLKHAFIGWWDDNVPRLGASLAYYTLFALSPILLVATSIAGLAFGQEFEVADVKVNKLDQPASGDFLPGGQVTLRGVTMKTLIGIGWKESRVLPELSVMSIAITPAIAQFNNVAENYLKGAPPWLNEDRFDVVAKAPPGTPADTIRLMMQKLLADRFHLAVPKEEKVMKVYAMVVAKGGAKLKPGQSTGNLVCDRSITDDNMYHR